MTTGQTPPSPSPESGSQAGSDEVRTGIDPTLPGLGETVDAIPEALPGKTDIKGEIKRRAAETRDHITESAHNARAAAADKAHTAQSTARGAVDNVTGMVKPRVPIAAVIAAAVVIGVVVWRRR